MHSLSRTTASVCPSLLGVLLFMVPMARFRILQTIQCVEDGSATKSQDKVVSLPLILTGWTKRFWSGR